MFRRDKRNKYKLYYLNTAKQSFLIKTIRIVSQGGEVLVNCSWNLERDCARNKSVILREASNL